MERGEYQCFTSGDQIEPIWWNDKNVLTIGSNGVSVEPVGNVKRWKRGKGSVNVSQSHVIKTYNKSMACVGLVDFALSDLRRNFNGKKWYWSLTINALSLGFVYCWRLHQLCTKSKGDQKSFCRAVVQVALMKAYSKVLRPGPSFAIPDDVRFDAKGHYPALGPVKKCVLWKKRAAAMCVKNVIGVCTQYYVFNFFMRSKSSI